MVRPPAITEPAPRRAFDAGVVVVPPCCSYPTVLAALASSARRRGWGRHGRLCGVTNAFSLMSLCLDCVTLCAAGLPCAGGPSAGEVPGSAPKQCACCGCSLHRHFDGGSCRGVGARWCRGGRVWPAAVSAQQTQFSCLATHPSPGVLAHKGNCPRPVRCCALAVGSCVDSSTGLTT